MTRSEAQAFISAFVALRQSATDEQAVLVPNVFPSWKPEKEYKTGDRIQYQGKLYKVITSHTSQEDWIPDKTPALWVAVSIEEYPEWVQPAGAHDAYNIGDKVTYKGNHYVCDINGNVYAPDVYGWTLIP